MADSNKTPKQAKKKPIDQHLLREWDQAWDHYRHLESTRSQYLGFFFTVLVASTGLAVGLLKDVSSSAQATVVFGLTVLGFIDFLITVGLFTAIKKTGYVLKRYEVIMKTVRQRSGFSSSQELPFDLADMKGYPGAVLDSRMFSVQRSAEVILGVSSFLFVVLLASLAAFLYTPAVSFKQWHQVMGLGMAIVGVVYLITVFGPLAIAAMKRLRNKHPPR